MSSLFTRFAWNLADLSELGTVTDHGPHPSQKSGARPVVNPAGIAASLREQADSLTEKIQHFKNPPISQQRPTPRRARIAEQMYKHGEYLERQQIYMRALADAWDAGTVPELLKKIRRRAQVEALMQEQGPALDALQAITQHKGPSAIDRRIRELELQLVSMPIPGYYPTPPDIIARMLELVGDEPGLQILEPSAGRGDIAQALRQKFPGALLDVIEWNATLQEILKLKGFSVVGHDFLQHSQPVNCIVMNPPFENNQDMEHIRHAYKLLKPGGVLVSVISEGPFFRKDRVAESFRLWLQSVGAHDERNADGAFLKSDRPTGVATRLVKIRKP